MTSRVTRIPRILRLAAAGAAAALAACGEDPEVFQPEPTANDGMFDRYVALGNSLTAGWQSGGINDSTQQESYAYLLATQAMETRFAYPSLVNPGCPPPVSNFQTQARVGGGAANTCLLRDPASVTGVLNNVGVPDAFAIDPTAATSASSNALTTFILGGRTQVQRALIADPTFLSLWIGNNDVLIGATTGLLAPNAQVVTSPGITTVADYTTRFDATVDALVAGAPAAEGVLVGVVNVTNIPLLFPVAALFNAQFKGGFDQFAGQATTIDPSCTPTTTALISFRLAGAIRAGFPAVIACAKGVMPTNPLVGDAFVLDAAELTTLAQTVAGYNAAIQARAATLGWAYFDPNPVLAAQRQTGQVPQVPNLANATAPFGPLFSLDGVHPSRAGHVLVANGIVAAINAQYGTSLPSVE